jgi:hypothetical protein
LYIKERVFPLGREGTVLIKTMSRSNDTFQQRQQPIVVIKRSKTKPEKVVFKPYKIAAIPNIDPVYKKMVE